MAISSADIGMILAAYGLRLEGGLSVVDLAAGRSDLPGNASLIARRAATLSTRTNLAATAVLPNPAPPTTTLNPASTIIQGKKWSHIRGSHGAHKQISFCRLPTVGHALSTLPLLLYSYRLHCPS